MDRLAIVEEHVRLENAHDLDGIMGTFGAVACYVGWRRRRQRPRRSDQAPRASADASSLKGHS